ncbi:hypothetical protein PUN28_013666 [Cardiocondyla obscurior]|uniref:Uncharacterized protein n=1 Tax=Cardiocondyla obscurior TaxID=286306 RepID=A0AAW2F5P8_9HYME
MASLRVIVALSLVMMVMYNCSEAARTRREDSTETGGESEMGKGESGGESDTGDGAGEGESQMGSGEGEEGDESGSSGGSPGEEAMEGAADVGIGRK